jgi:hypothetical protein
MTPSITTLSIMTRRIMGLFATLSIETQYNSIECRYAERRYAECRYAVCRYAVCRYAVCHYAECRCAECHGAQNVG